MVERVRLTALEKACEIKYLRGEYNRPVGWVDDQDLPPDETPEEMETRTTQAQNYYTMTLDGNIDPAYLDPTPQPSAARVKRDGLRHSIYDFEDDWLLREHPELRQYCTATCQLPYTHKLMEFKGYVLFFAVYTLFFGIPTLLISRSWLWGFGVGIGASIVISALVYRNELHDTRQRTKEVQQRFDRFLQKYSAISPA